MASNRDLWLPDWATTVIEEHGREWPLILVEKWEQNGIGERRLVTSLIYSPPAASASPRIHPVGEGYTP